MRIGHLDRRVTFIKPIYSLGSAKQDEIIGWEVIDSKPEVWAQKIENSGRTGVDDDRVTWSKITSWHVRFREDLNVNMRLVWNTKVYSIVTFADVDEDRNRYLKIETNFLDNVYFT